MCIGVFSYQGGGGGGRLDPLNFVKKVEKGEKYFQNQDPPPCELIPEYASVSSVCICVQIDYLSSHRPFIDIISDPKSPTML